MSSRPRIKKPVEHLNNLVLGSTQIDNWHGRWRKYFEPIPELSGTLPAPILGIMVLIWQLRDKDLQHRYSLRTRDSRLGFLGWCVVHGRKEYKSLAKAKVFWDALDQPATFDEALPESDPATGLTWLMVLALRERADLAFDLATFEGREQLLAWYIMHGRYELGFSEVPLPHQVVRYLMMPSSVRGLTRLQALIYHARADVRLAFPLDSSQAAFVSWFRNHITVETRLIDALRCFDDAAATAGNHSEPPTLQSGVNVIGYAFGQLGIGEDGRMAVRSLLTTALPVSLIDFPPGNAIPQADFSMVDYVDSVPKYNVNMFCLTALEQGRCFAERGLGADLKQHNIGYWPWELPDWPEEWRHLFALVDEIWVSSPYTFDAVSAVSPVPVRLMPMAVTVDDVSVRSRQYFGLPEKACLFLFAFDLNSSAKRKNPEACISAFLSAFPKGSKENVGLVIKAHPPQGPNRAWSRLKALQRNDPRIFIIEETLERSELLALYKVCDCFVSLHRAEGFGRSIAEAMLLGKPVIVTGFSGNLAFNDVNNALLVDYVLVDLDKNDYPFGAGQRWAEPCILTAGHLMRTVAQGTSNFLGLRGQERIAQQHSPVVVGQRYVAALRIFGLDVSSHQLDLAKHDYQRRR
jgi:glycosyltransferase involved in cell wall biosynthesis